MGWSPTGLPLPIWNSPNDQRCREEAVQACSVRTHGGTPKRAGIKNTPMHVVRSGIIVLHRNTRESRRDIDESHDNPQQSKTFQSALPTRIPETPSNISRNRMPQVFLTDVIITTASMQPNGGPLAPKLIPSTHEQEVGDGESNNPKNAKISNTSQR